MEKEIIELVELMRKQQRSLKQYESTNIDLIQVRYQMLDGLRDSIKIAMDFLHLRNDETYYKLQRKYEEVSDLYYRNRLLLDGVRTAGEIDDKIKEVKKYIQYQDQNYVDSMTTDSFLSGDSSTFVNAEDDNLRFTSGDPNNNSYGYRSLFKDNISNNLEKGNLEDSAEQNYDSLGDIIEFIDQALWLVGGNEILQEYIEKLKISVCYNFGIKDPDWVRSLIDERILFIDQEIKSHCK